MRERNKNVLTNTFAMPSRRANNGAQVNTPQFPGWQEGLSQSQVQGIIKNQKRIKGYLITAGTGETVTNLELSGTARIFVGFALQPLVQSVVNDVGAYPNEFQLTINNEIIIDRVHPIFFGADYMDSEYYQIIRPLSGQDTITSRINNTQASTTIGLTIYYI
jgi:hypothetical protein